jgi:5'-AMP-activated protein kinase regulatory beta subunit
MVSVEVHHPLKAVIDLTESEPVFNHTVHHPQIRTQMKPNPVDATVAVVNHQMEASHIHVVERRSKGHRCKVKVGAKVQDGPIPKNISPLSPRNADVVFQSLDWDMHCDEYECFDCTTPSGESSIISERKHPVVFRWLGEGRSVYLSGSFDNWKTKIPLVRSHDEMYTIVEIPLGVHQYKFLVDGRWVCQPTEPQVVGDVGTPNNVITVSESDCDPFTALEKDDINNGSPPASCVSKAPTGYSQYIPPRDPCGFNFLRHGPPLLPPHLLQSVLNAEVPPQTDPTMVPQPNHVVLDHTFTLSIRDGVMVLSTTHRYRQKFVTTLLYRPI